MIVSNRKHMFGFSSFGVVQGATFGCVVITAPEGLFKGCSTVFLSFEGEWSEAANKRLVAKAILNPSLSRKERAGIHDTFLNHLDTLENSGIDLASAIDQVFAAAKKGGAVVDSVSEAHAVLVSDEPHDLSGASEFLINQIEANRVRVEADAERLSALLEKVADRVGKPVVGLIENGEVFIHPDLARELERPGNEGLREMLLMGARAKGRTLK